MATGRSSFAKRQRDMAKKARAEAKRARRLEARSHADDEDPPSETPDGPRLSNEQIMEKVAELHRRYDDGEMDLDTFEEQKAALMAQISID